MQLISRESLLLIPLKRFFIILKIYFSLIKAKLQEIQNSISIASNINEDIFAEFNVILNMFNGIWQKQEEIRRQKVMDEENLYVTK